jgi:hypothetical protein
MEETYGKEEQNAPRYNWGLFLDSCAGMVAQAWAAMPWWDRWLHTFKSLTWLRYLQELRSFDWAQVMANNTTHPPIDITIHQH